MGPCSFQPLRCNAEIGTSPPPVWCFSSNNASPRARGTSRPQVLAPEIADPDATTASDRCFETVRELSEHRLYADKRKQRVHMFVRKGRNLEDFKCGVLALDSAHMYTTSPAPLRPVTLLPQCTASRNTRKGSRHAHTTSGHGKQQASLRVACTSYQVVQGHRHISPLL